MHYEKDWLAQTQGEWVYGLFQSLCTAQKPSNELYFQMLIFPEDLVLISLWPCSIPWLWLQHFCCTNPKSNSQHFQNDVLLFIIVALLNSRWWRFQWILVYSTCVKFYTYLLTLGSYLLMEELSFMHSMQSGWDNCLKWKKK